MEVSILKPSRYDQWDEFVDASPQGSLFAHPYYLDACQADYDILACTDAGGIAGGIVLSKSKWGKYTNPLLCKYLGIIMRDFEGSRYRRETSGRKVQSALVEAIGRKRSFNYMFHPSYTDWLPFYWAGYKQTTKYTYRIPLLPGSDPAVDFNSRLRGKINKIEKEEKYTITRHIDVDQADALMNKTFSHQKKKNPFSRKWLDHYISSLRHRDLLDITGLVDQQGKLTCILGMLKGREAHYLVLNGIDHAVVSAGQNELLIHAALVKAREQGVSHFDFEGSMIRNVESFYRQFGGVLTPYFVIGR
jgi:hypothetical protein